MKLKRNFFLLLISLVLLSSCISTEEGITLKRWPGMDINITPNLQVELKIDPDSFTLKDTNHISLSEGVRIADIGQRYAELRPVVEQYLNRFIDYWNRSGEANVSSLYVNTMDAVAAMTMWEANIVRYGGQITHYTYDIVAIQTENSSIQSILVRFTTDVLIWYGTVMDSSNNDGWILSWDHFDINDFAQYTINYVFDVTLVNTDGGLKCLDFRMNLQEDIDRKNYDVDAPQPNASDDFIMEYTDDIYLDLGLRTYDGDRKAIPSEPLTSGNLKQIIAMNNAKTVAVLVINDDFTEVGQGSGFFIAPGVVMTNYHVIEGMSDGLVRLVNGACYGIEGVVAADAELDLAVIKLDTQIGQAVSIGSYESCEKGDFAIAIGSPLGLFNTTSTGIISNLLNDGSRNLVQTTVPITYGNSGGPLFNDKGEVIAVNTFIIVGNGDLSFSVAIDHAYGIISAVQTTAFSQIGVTPLHNVFGGSSLTREMESVLADEFGYLAS